MVSHPQNPSGEASSARFVHVLSPVGAALPGAFLCAAFVGAFLHVVKVGRR